MFKKVFFGVVLAIGFLFGFSPGADAIEDRGAFIITKFAVDIFVKKDATIEVEEIIDANFFQKRHGIFREIPVKYTDDHGFKYNMKLQEISVSDQQGNDFKFEQFKEGGDLVLKIGDPDKEVIGDVRYVIRYKIQKGMRFFTDHDEIYWNPIGVGWPTKIYNASSAIHFEENIDFLQENSLCFTGKFGSTESDCTIDVISGREVGFRANKVLDKYEGLTVAVNLPKGLVKEPTKIDYFLLFLQDNWAFTVPILLLGAMFFLWYFRGKELDLKRPLIAQYGAPEGLTPGEMGFLLKEHYSHKFVAADIVNLAIKGYLEIREVESEESELVKKIKTEMTPKARIVMAVAAVIIILFFALTVIREEGGFNVINVVVFVQLVGFLAFFFFFAFNAKERERTGRKSRRRHLKIVDYQLENKKDWSVAQDLTPHEKVLLKGLFAGKVLEKIKLSEKKKFYRQVQRASLKIKKQIELKGYFEKSKYNSKLLYVLAGCLFGFLMFITGIMLQRVDFIISAVLTAAVLIGFGIIMSKKTRKGAEAYWHAQGYKHYIDVAERYRARFNEKENIFEKTLPYAMIFGNLDRWAQVFEGVVRQPPSWYHPQRPGLAFNPSTFSHSLSRGFAAAADSASASPSSSSSGGSSGGGGGGGGGGSW